MSYEQIQNYMVIKEMAHAYTSTINGGKLIKKLAFIRIINTKNGGELWNIL